MAGIKRTGKTFTVVHGVTGQVLSRHKSRGSATARVKVLHRKNKPKPQNRNAPNIKK